MRLQKFLAQAGVASRRKCEEIIAQGRVRVNGKRVDTMGYIVEQTDRVELDGKLITEFSPKLYLLLNKPRGVVSTAQDDKGRKTVLDFVPKELPRLFPVGRLDYDSEGLLILTNDGAFANRMMHPRYEVKKTYRVKLKGEMTAESIERLKAGVTLEDGLARADAVDLLGYENGKTYLNISVHEGRNRIIRRMGEAVGHEVLRLRRTEYGPLTLSKLRQGQWRHLSPKELNELGK
ncbi:MAG: pseudouridine synthase [Christensenellales bacterium]